MNSRGFSLTELMFALGVSVVVVVALVGALMGMKSIFFSIKDTSSIENEARVVGRYITQELQKAGGINIEQDSPAGSGSDRITYRLPKTDSQGVPILESSGKINWEAFEGAPGKEISVTFTSGNNTGRLRVIDEYDAEHTISRNVKQINFFDSSVDSGLYPAEMEIVVELEKTDANGRTYNATVTVYVHNRNIGE